MNKDPDKLKCVLRSLGFGLAKLLDCIRTHVNGGRKREKVVKFAPLISPDVEVEAFEVKN